MQLTCITLSAMSSFFLLLLPEVILKQKGLLRYGTYRKSRVSPTLLGTTALFSCCNYRIYHTKTDLLIWYLLE